MLRGRRSRPQESGRRRSTSCRCRTPRAGAELIHLAECGLCEHGEQTELYASGATSIDGALPVNTDGGCLANGEPVGASGLRQVYEIVTQLRGEAGCATGARQPQGRVHARLRRARCERVHGALAVTEFWRMGATPVPVREIGRFAQEFEASGWDGLAVGEAHGLLPDPYTTLAVAAAATTTLKVGTAVAVPLRHPSSPRAQWRHSRVSRTDARGSVSDAATAP